MIEAEEEVVAKDKATDTDEVGILTTMIPITTTKKEKALQEVVGEDIQTQRYGKSQVECYNCHKFGYFARKQ